MLGQATLLPVGFAVAVLALHAAGGSAARRILTGGAVLSVAFAVVYALQGLRSDFEFSRGAGLVAYAVAVVLMVVGEALPPGHVRKGATIALALPACFVGLAIAMNARPFAQPAESDSTTKLLTTSCYPIRLTYHDVVHPRDRQPGGGITPVGDVFLGVTGAGAFYALRWHAETGSLTSQRLSFSSPSSSAEFVAAAPANVRGGWFRVLDVVARESGDGWQLLVSHHMWDGEQNCYYVSMSRLDLDGALEPRGD